MNNIYKVIWSKAKNCYVVASEIARSHTKSASGSTEKIGGVTRKTLLALGAACAIVCGGFVNVGAEDGVISVVPDTTSSSSAQDIYTKDGADSKFGLKTDVDDLKKAMDENIDGSLAKAVKDNTSGVGDLRAATGKIDTKVKGLNEEGTTLTGMTTVSGTNVEATDLKVTGNITDGGTNTTTVKDIKDSMAQTETNKVDIATIKNTLTNESTGLVKKTEKLETKTGQLR